MSWALKKLGCGDGGDNVSWPSGGQLQLMALSVLNRK